MTSITTNDGYFSTIKDFEDYWKKREKKALKRGKKEIIKLIKERFSETSTIDVVDFEELTKEK